MVDAKAGDGAIVSATEGMVAVPKRIRQARRNGSIRIGVRRIVKVASHYHRIFTIGNVFGHLITLLSALLESQENMQLVTIRHYRPDTLQKALNGKEPIISQEGKVMARYVV